MQLGLFTMPSHPPECSLYDGHEWDLQTLRWADELWPFRVTPGRRAPSFKRRRRLACR
jgi:hypothetical protein